jgi:superfamily II DNA or RNA helicase/HKD family nuclease
MAVAFVTKSGVISILNQLIDLEDRGIRGKVLVSQYQNFSQPEALRTLLALKNIELKISNRGAFHAKSYIFSKSGGYSDIFVGSSNLTASALSTNKEWNLKVSAWSESKLLKEIQLEFEREFATAVSVTAEYIDAYEPIYKLSNERAKSLAQQGAELTGEIRGEEFFSEKFEGGLATTKPVNERPAGGVERLDMEVGGAKGPVNGMLVSPSGPNPNRMQLDALGNLSALRAAGKKKALIISATGSGKTLLSAFDVKQFKAKRLLFVVHRRNIAEAAMRSFKSVHGKHVTMGLLSGSAKDYRSDFIFATNLTIAGDEHLQRFRNDEFDYIVLDESHRTGAESYKKIISYFKPQFLLGMTATPERNDGFDIYDHFDHNIAYEIRLKAALEEEMVCPFHYFGVTDVSVNGQIIEKESAFSLLEARERIDHIIRRIKQYGTDSGKLYGLVFCSRIDECVRLAAEFTKSGYRSIALDGSSSEDARAAAIQALEGLEIPKTLDFIFTVDIFNEGVDIPKVNLAVLLRPTESSIIFVQQLGRGLRNIDGKEYLTVIDFVGNYEGNYHIPIALFGDNTFNKDNLRRLVAAGSTAIPGSSTVNFDRIVESKIIDSINQAKFSRRADLLYDYNQLSLKLGRMPMMIDFVKHGSRDPALYAEVSKSYLSWCCSRPHPSKLGQI